ncbi:unnamed protein product, partial [Scytosiphon promiscuus]
MNQVELEMYRVHGLTDKTDNRGSVWIKFDLGYSKDEKIGKGFTQSYRSDHDTVNMDYKTPCYVKRARSTQMAFQNRRTGLEIFHKKNIGRSVGQPACLAEPAFFHLKRRRLIPFQVRSSPWSSSRALGRHHQCLSISAKVARCPHPGTTIAPHVPSLPPTIPLVPMSCSALHLPFTQSRLAPTSTPGVVLPCFFCREKNNPFAVENLDSNNVLEAEIEAVTAKAASGDLASVMRKGALETKLLV